MAHKVEISLVFVVVLLEFFIGSNWLSGFAAGLGTALALMEVVKWRTK